MTLEAPPDIDDEYIRANWLQLAAIAWRGFCASGRGLVMMGLPRRVRLATVEDPAVYIPAGDVRAKLRLEEPGASTIERVLAEYDPTRAVVLAVAFPLGAGQERGGYRVLAYEPAPPAAAARHGN